jgi:hypothetical protein
MRPTKTPSVGDDKMEAILPVAGHWRLSAINATSS